MLLIKCTIPTALPVTTDISPLSTALAKCQNVEIDGRAAAVSALSGVTSVQISQQGAMISLTTQRQGIGHAINHLQCSSSSYTHNKYCIEQYSAQR